MRVLGATSAGVLHPSFLSLHLTCRRSVIPPFSRSVVPSFRRSAVPPFQTS
jgi:hypothetical protein